MNANPSDLESLVKHVKETFGPVEMWVIPRGYPNDLACCVIDSIYSTGSHYNSVKNVITKYCENTDNDGTTSSLKASIVRVGGPQAWADNVVNNKKPAHTKTGAPLKAEVIDQAADLLLSLGIESVEDLKVAVTENPTNNLLHSGWKKLPSQKSGITYNYLLILSGLPSVKPDRMVHRFLKTTLGNERQFTNQQVIDLIRETANLLDVSASTLDHMIWRYASGRTI